MCVTVFQINCSRTHSLMPQDVTDLTAKNEFLTQRLEAQAYRIYALEENLEKKQDKDPTMIYSTEEWNAYIEERLCRLEELSRPVSQHGNY